MDTETRSIGKTLTYRIASMALVMAVATAAGCSWGDAATLAAADCVLKLALYYLHERLWARL